MTAKQVKFVDAFVGEANANASLAARLAGYGEKTAAKSATKNLKNPKIQAAIVERLRSAALGPDEVLARLGEQARGVGGEFYTTDAQGRTVLDVPKLLKAGKGHMILELSQTEYGQRVKFASSQTALLQLGRRHRLFVDRQEVSGVDGSAVMLALSAALDKVYGDEAE